MKFNTVFVSAPFESNKGLICDFPYLTFADKKGVMMNVINDTSTINGMMRELNSLKQQLNRECNVRGLALSDVDFKIEWEV